MNEGVPERPPESVRDADAAVLDIRRPDDYAEAHIPGSENVPFDDLEAAVEDGREWDDVVVVCYVGETSVQAARYLRAVVDADAASMAGGFEAWDGPIERQPPAE